MAEYVRTHTCGALRASDEGTHVVLCGWVHRVRDLGGLLFIDLRDRYGITQLIIDPKQHPAAAATSGRLRAECVVTAHGVVSLRKDPNPRMATGGVEVLTSRLQLLSSAEVPPFPIADTKSEANEELRLKYRYLDMRRGHVLANLALRHRAMMATRTFLDSEGFVEVVTPVLAKSTPEGARDYLVPSRIHPGSFYALPQSPQMFKQLLMIGGLDRYFQIATCFRDEDPRADRQPEFAQIDLEMSFATQNELFLLIERLVAAIFWHVRGIEILTPFRRVSHAHCLEQYGSDKPDLRYGMPLVRLDEVARASTFAPFLKALSEGGCVKGLCIKGGATCSRKEIDEYAQFISQFGFEGLSWVRRAQGSLTASMAKFFPPPELEACSTRLEIDEGDLALIAAGPAKKVDQALDHLRRKIAKDRQLIDPNRYECLWVTDFPLFTFNEETVRIESEHHPFTSPHRDDISFLESDPLRVRSSSYDLVMNGYEIASGSERIFDGALQDKIFEILGFNMEERVSKFGFFIEALKFGTPPHLGIALGFDRLIMMLAGVDSIREVIAFPKTLKACDVMMDAPSAVTQGQLDELRLSIHGEKKAR